MSVNLICPFFLMVKYNFGSFYFIITYIIEYLYIAYLVE